MLLVALFIFLSYSQTSSDGSDDLYLGRDGSAYQFIKKGSAGSFFRDGSRPLSQYTSDQDRYVHDRRETIEHRNHYMSYNDFKNVYHPEEQNSYGGHIQLSNTDKAGAPVLFTLEDPDHARLSK